MDAFTGIYLKWRKSFIKVGFFIAAVNLFLEITMSIFLLQNYPEMIKLKPTAYTILYIIVPSCLNFGMVWLGSRSMSSARISERTKNYI